MDGPDQSQSSREEDQGQNYNKNMRGCLATRRKNECKGMTVTVSRIARELDVFERASPQCFEISLNKEAKFQKL